MYNCEECLAANILLKAGLIDNPEVIDKPDIRSKDEDVEVTIVVSDKFELISAFGNIHNQALKNLSDWNCLSCPYLLECKNEFNEEWFYVRCKATPEVVHWIEDGSSIIDSGCLFYQGRDNPTCIPLSTDAEGTLDDLQAAVDKKESKITNYKEYSHNKPISLFLFYDKWIDKLPSLKSDLFTNIYIYVYTTGQLYKNNQLVTTISNHTKCMNRSCSEFDIRFSKGLDSKE